jgi:plastocyanin
MYKISHIFIFSLAFLLAFAALAACGSAEKTPAPGATIPGISISIKGSTCPSVQINHNDQITWTNEDTVEHPIRVEYSDGNPLADLGVLKPGDSASLTFPQAGSFRYTCSGGQESTGTITVQP